MYREKSLDHSSDPDATKTVQFFDKKSEDKDPETKYASLPELNGGGREKASTIQDDFDADDEDI